MSLDIAHLQQWIGKTETLTDQAVATPIDALAATLDRKDPPARVGDSIPPCWHWLYFLPLHRHSELGPDGHAKRGEFLPPVPLPRRMWAGSRIEFKTPLQVGEALSRTSRIADVRSREGRAGPVVFVNVHHEICGDNQLAIVEEHDIVYRDMPRGESAPEGTQAPNDAHWSRRIDPDDVLLFRYSALTFNGHRIHYDRRYATNVEGYPGLVVHGPLIATLLLDLLRSELPAAEVKTFSFRAIKPLCDVAPFHVCGRHEDKKIVKLWARTPEGHVAMDASATLN
ncbi:MAG: FAS1-like dehydratase domain-containing protein [Burkholderiaceae bacterium]